MNSICQKGFIGESGRLIGDIIAITDILNKKGFLVTMDIQKALDYYIILLPFLFWKKLVLVTVLLVGIKPQFQNKNLA